MSHINDEHTFLDRLFFPLLSSTWLLAAFIRLCVTLIFGFHDDHH